MCTRYPFYVILITAVFYIGSIQLFAQDFSLKSISDLTRVFEDGYNMPATSDAIEVFGIRGEIISGQCVVKAEKNLTNVTVEVSSLKNQAGNHVITA